MTGVILHSHVSYKEIQARTCCGPLFSSVKLGDQAGQGRLVLADLVSIVRFEVLTLVPLPYARKVPL